jgi:hypothetical protein
VSRPGSPRFPGLRERGGGRDAPSRPDSPSEVKATAERIAAGEVVTDADAEAVVDALSDATLSAEGFDGAE